MDKTKIALMVVGILITPIWVSWIIAILLRYMFELIEDKLEGVIDWIRYKTYKHFNK